MTPEPEPVPSEHVEVEPEEIRVAAPAPFTPDEREAFELVDGETLAAVTSAGGLKYGLKLTIPNLVAAYGVPTPENACPDARREAARRALFQIAVYCLRRNVPVESNIARRWSHLPEDVRPTIEDLDRIARLARVFQDRCRRDLDEDRIEETTGEPRICVTDAVLHEMSSAALAVLNMRNIPPRLFARNGFIVRIQADDQGLTEFKALAEAGLAGELDRMIEWYRTLNGGDERPASPPPEVVKDILALPPSEWGLPPLKTVMATPIFRPDGTIHDAPGYDEETQLYYAPVAGFELPAVPEIPTHEDVANARAQIEEMFCDFAFVTAADRANALGALLTPILRPCIEGAVPLYIVSKPQAGVGAGLLQRSIGIVAEGHEPSMKTLPSSDAELRKEILATLRAGTTLQIFDNVTEQVASPELAAVLTAARYTGRILGVTEEASFAISTVWMLNGVNVRIAGDMARRSYRSLVDPQTAIPWQRPEGAFRHPDLLAWALQNRGQILAAVYTLARAWIQAGRPEPQRVQPLGSYTEWRFVIGGILEHAGVEGFLDNAKELYLEADSDRVQWEAFLEELASIFGCEPFPVNRVTRILNDDAAGEGHLVDLLPDDLAELFVTRRRTFTQVLGMAFTKIRDRHFPGGWCLKQGKLAKGTRRWVIVRSKPALTDGGGVEPLTTGVEPSTPGVEPCADHNRASSHPDRQKNDTEETEFDGGGSGGTCSSTPRRKKNNISGTEKKNNCTSSSGCTRFHHFHPGQNPHSVEGLESGSDVAKGRDGITQGSTPGVEGSTPDLDPPPAGCLKHPIERYEKRKYDPSILCIVPGCRRPAEYGAGAGFPLCEGHYQAERRRVSGREGADAL